MTFKALAIDLDGTLLIGDALPEAHRKAVAAASRAGLQVIIATARWRQMAERTAAETGIQGPIIACSGAQVYVPGTGDIFDHRLPGDFVEDLYDICNSYPCFASVAVGDDVFLKLDSEPDTSKLPDEMTWVPRLDSGSHGAPRLAIIQGTEVNEAIRRGLQPGYHDTVNIYDSIGPTGRTLLTITASAAHKGEALIACCAHLGIDPSEVVAFGDAENDIAMFKVAGLSVAMGQADDIVKAAATHVTKANTENGVAVAIDRLLSTGHL